jgi:hypothetical protein
MKYSLYVNIYKFDVGTKFEILFCVFAESEDVAWCAD